MMSQNKINDHSFEVQKMSLPKLPDDIIENLIFEFEYGVKKCEFKFLLASLIDYKLKSDFINTDKFIKETLQIDIKRGI